MRGRLNPPRSHTRSHRNHTSTACMQLLWHFEALVLPKNCERPAVIQIDLNYIPRVDELARRAPTLMHSFSTTLLQNTFCFHDCFLPRFSWFGAKFTGSGQKTQSHAKSSKPKSMTYQTTTTNVANYMQEVWRIQCYPGLVDYSTLVRGMFTTNENILTYTSHHSLKWHFTPRWQENLWELSALQLGMMQHTILSLL